MVAAAAVVVVVVVRGGKLAFEAHRPLAPTTPNTQGKRFGRHARIGRVTKWKRWGGMRLLGVFEYWAGRCVFEKTNCRFSRPADMFTPPLSGGSDLDSRNSGWARLGGEVGPPLGVVVEEVAVLVVLVRRHRHAVRAAVRRAVDDEVQGAIKEETGPAAVRRVSPGFRIFTTPLIRGG